MKKILCIGDLCADVLIPYQKTLDNLKLVEQGDVTQERVLVRYGGSVANTCAILAKLKEKPIFVTDLCNDTVGKYLKDQMEDLGVDLSYSKVGDSDTLQCLAVIGKGGERLIFPYLLPDGKSMSFTKDSFDESLLKDDYIIFTGGMVLNNDEESMKSAYEFIKKMKEETSSTFIFDLNTRFETYGNTPLRMEYYNKFIELSDILIGSGNQEFVPLVDGCKDMVEVAKHFARNGRVVIARDGSNPIHIVYNDHEEVIALDKVKQVCTIGAGDSFNGAFLYAYRYGHSLKECCEFASYIAAYIISHEGHFEMPIDALEYFD